MFETGPSDAYARLPFETGRAWYPRSHTGGICFLDVSAGDRSLATISGYLNALPPSLVARSIAVLVRWGAEGLGWESAPAAAEQLSERLRQLGHAVPVGIITFGISVDPAITWSTAHGPADDATLLARARAIELYAYLSWGEAIWRPGGYHYQLPSGRHATTFVRVADAFHDVRAAGAMATWLYNQVDTDASSALVVDTGALSALAAELRLAVAEAAFAVGSAQAGLLPVYALDAYPESNLVLQQHLAKNLEGVRVLGLVSVSHSGTLAARLRNALDSITTEFVVEQIVRRNGPHAVELPTQESGRGRVTDAWLSLPDSVGTRSCSACDAPETSQIVRIDPRSMTALLLPEPVRVVPDVIEAQRNSSLFETYDRAYTDEILGPIGAHAAAISYLGPTQTRPAGPAGLAEIAKSVFFEPAALISEGVVSNRLQQLTKLRKRTTTDAEPSQIVGVLERIRAQAPRLVVIDKGELDVLDQLGSLPQLLTELADLLGDDPAIAEFQVDEDGNGQIEANGSGPSPSVLVLALGVRTGVTLHRMFLAARDRWPEAEFAGVVLHAHPSDSRTWASAQNTFKDAAGATRLLGLWLTYLPDWSPLRAEQQFLEQSLPVIESLVALGKADATVVATCQARIDDLNSGRPPQTLWGPTEQHVRQGSYFGEGLSSAALLAAVGSGLHSSRLKARGPYQPQWIAVDMPRVLRSYFDGTIHASALRWVSPGECWWGQAGGLEAAQLIEELRHQQKPDWPILLPELLLAGAMGKLPREAVDHLVAASEESFDGRDEIQQWIDLGVSLIESPSLD